MRGPRPWVAAAVVWALVILAFGVIPAHETLQATVGAWENLVASAGHFAVAIDGWRVSSRALVGAALGAVALGWVIEVVQLPLSYRDFQVADGVVDMAGAAAGLALFSGVATWRAARPRERRG
jgi:hypothetical protein